MFLTPAGFILAAALVILLPGPDTLVVLRSLIRSGARPAARTASGVIVGLVCWAGIAAVGLSALLRASETGYLVLRIVGGCYLALLGVQALRSRGATAELTSAADEARRSSRLFGTGFTAGLVSNLFNPKVGVFFITFLPAFVPQGQPVGWFSAALGLIFAAETAVYFWIFIRAADRILGALRRPRFRAWLDRITGLVLVGFGVRLATET